MNDEQAFEIIGARAKAIANEESIKQQCLEMHQNGVSLDDINAYVYNLAIATLYGKVE